MYKAIRYLRKWSGISIDFSTIDEKLEQDCILVGDSSVAPHMVDSIVEDGDCLFRAIPKTVTGTQNNHSAVRQAMIRWMIGIKYHPKLAGYVASKIKLKMTLLLFHKLCRHTLNLLVCQQMAHGVVTKILSH